MKTPFRLLLPVLLLGMLAPSPVRAQTSNYAQWVSIPITGDIGENESRAQLWLDLHARR